MTNNGKTLRAYKDEVAALRRSIKSHWEDRRNSSPHDGFLGAAAQRVPVMHQRELGGFQLRRYLKGHHGKVSALAWSPDSNHLVSVGQDGRLIHWNAYTTNKTRAIRLNSTWVMTCAMSPDNKTVALGGLTNSCTLYDLSRAGDAPLCELRHHTGYLSSVEFLDASSCMTASGDAECLLWDLDTNSVKQSFRGHASDVMGIALGPGRNTFVSGSCDMTAKLWDIRTGTSVMTFEGHDSDVNCVKWMPTSNGTVFATGSDDSTCRLFDIRACTEMQSYQSDRRLDVVTSLDFSKSSSNLFVGYGNGELGVYNTVTGKDTGVRPRWHDRSLSCLQVSPDGEALATGSWDEQIFIHA